MVPIIPRTQLGLRLIALAAPFLALGMNRVAVASHRTRTPASEFAAWKTRLMDIVCFTQKIINSVGGSGPTGRNCPNAPV